MQILTIQFHMMEMQYITYYAESRFYRFRKIFFV